MLKLKYIFELLFQFKYAKLYSANKHIVFEDWEKYHGLTKILAVLKIKNTTKILDVGCGISTVLHYIPVGLKYGIDPLANYYRLFYRYPKDIKIQRGSGENIPFPDNQFDVTFCSNAIDHTSNPLKVISEINRILKPNGYFVLTVEIFNEKVERGVAHPHSLSEADVRGLLKKYFKVVFEKRTIMNTIGKRKVKNRVEYFVTPSLSKTEELIFVLQNVKDSKSF
jgi:ubiquinone/menaquinone biosynthesis C-methylase UbiE